MKRWGILALLALLLGLQYSLWFGDSSLPKFFALTQEVEQQEKQVQQLRERNEMLIAEVKDLKERLEAVEERARTDFGMIKKNETFYFVAEEK